MGVLPEPNESSGFRRIVQTTLNSDNDAYTSGEESKLLKNEKEPSKPKQKYPKSVFFIVGNEFCERFCFYGLRTILTLYLTQRLFYSDDTATIIFHSFGMLAYFTPLFGAIMADSFVGKFNTILYVSILYAIGCIALSIGSFPLDLSIMKIVSITGLFIIGVGTGGIKPCVSAFGGDQFKEGQEKELKHFFSLFYLSINLGSVFSTLLTPVLREELHCLGEKTCYPVAFGVPAALMVIALILFACGKPLYTIRPPDGNIIVKISKCICYAIGKKCKSSEKKKSHWLDYADDKFDKNLIRDIKILLHVLVLYIPLPFFWALFDQMGSRWTLQATRLDGSIGFYHIKPDQMQVLNSIMIVIFIPLFDYAIYPLLDKCNLLKRPLQRMTVGGILAAISFALAGLIEFHLEDRLPVFPEPGQSEMTIVNNSPCRLTVDAINTSTLDPFKVSVIKELTLEKQYTWKFNPTNCDLTNDSFSLTFKASDPIMSMMVTVYDGNLTAQEVSDTKEKSEDGEPMIRLFYNFHRPSGNVTILFKNIKEDQDEYSIDITSADAFGTTEYSKMGPGSYNVYLPVNETHHENKPIIKADFRSGGVYILTIYNRTAKESPQRVSTRYEMVKGNSLTILLQIPQYLIITAGEIMFSITGLEFSYSQSPTSMKSVVQAAWLMTVAFGNLIVLVITEFSSFEKQSNILFLFSVLMAADMIVFAILAYFYKYVKITPKDSGESVEIIETVPSQEGGSTNEGYIEERL